MNAPLLPEVLLHVDPPEAPQLPLAAQGVQRFVWQSRFGPMLIEVQGEALFVNGEPVEPAPASASSPAAASPCATPPARR